MLRVLIAARDVVGTHFPMRYCMRSLFRVMLCVLNISRDIYVVTCMNTSRHTYVSCTHKSRHIYISLDAHARQCCFVLYA